MQSTVKKIYIAEATIPQRGDVFLVSLLKGVKGNYGMYTPETLFHFEIELVNTEEAADSILFPQAVTSNEEFQYVKKHSKPTYVFIGGDLSHNVWHKDFVILKATQYKRHKKDNEVIIPPINDDLGEGGVTIREKGIKPIVSFCGWAGFRNPIERIKYYIKNSINFFTASIIFRKGLYFRRKAINACKDSSLIDTHFIIRNSFGGHSNTISLDPDVARKEYIENMVNSDFVLAPKGDANYSVRFFEALSLGRIPILIDTEVCLPYEDILDYSSCVLKISYKDINKIPEIVSHFWNELSNEQYKEMQQRAREVYKNYLRYDAFFNKLFKL